MEYEVYDCEVFKYDWIVVFKNQKNEYHIFHNDNEKLKNYIDENKIYIGFNSKFYDHYIIKAIVADFDNEKLKDLSDYIVSGNYGFSYKGFSADALFSRIKRLNNVDIKDDMQPNLSLKAIEGHLGLPIKESSVSFDIDRKLNENELKESIEYCKYDVDSTEKIVKLRNGYLQTKVNLGNRAGIDEKKALHYTNANLTAAILRARKIEWLDGRKYEYPKNLDKSSIPIQVLEFFNQITDENISDEELFKKKLEITLGNMQTTYAWGGVHGSLLNYKEEKTDKRIIQNRDVASLYPTLIEKYNYLSRNVPDKEIYSQILKDRLKAKKDGDKQLASDLKLPLNTVSGAQENQYNALYDPLPTRAMRISGQLFLTMLVTRLLRECKSIKLINLNTDGVMYSVDKDELETVDKICNKWEEETHLILETDDIKRVFVKDVNNLVFEKENGDIKTVGGYLNYGISNKGAWTINNNACAIKKSLLAYLIENKPIETSINENNNVLDFQFIANVSGKYKKVFHDVNGMQEEQQKVNRVYASKNKAYGTLYKVKLDGQVSKVENIPDNCIIDNENKIKIEDIDKEFYIKRAKQKLDEFIKEREMATTKNNVYKKLSKARQLFLNNAITKSGKNMNMQYMYFKLEDIVPLAINIFEELGLTTRTEITSDIAKIEVINVENTDEVIEFSVPFTPIEPIVSNSGKMVTNRMQATGASITYIRRYLIMLVLDICENDVIDSGELIETTKPKIPISNEERTNIKNDLTSVNDKATELQIKQLKIVLKELITKKPEEKARVQEINIQTQAFTNLSKKQCEEMIKSIQKELNENEVVK